MLGSVSRAENEGPPPSFRSSSGTAGLSSGWGLAVKDSFGRFGQQAVISVAGRRLGSAFFLSAQEPRLNTGLGKAQGRQPNDSPRAGQSSRSTGSPDRDTAQAGAS